MSEYREIKLTIDKEKIEAMVRAFLVWPLPDTFSPDGGISFDRTANGKDRKELGPAWWPVGTNLLNADEARQMFEYVLAKVAAPIPHNAGEHWELTREIWLLLESSRDDTPAALSHLESRLATFAMEREEVGRRKGLEEAAALLDGLGTNRLTGRPFTVVSAVELIRNLAAVEHKQGVEANVESKS